MAIGSRNAEHKRAEHGRGAHSTERGAQTHGAQTHEARSIACCATEGLMRATFYTWMVPWELGGSHGSFVGALEGPMGAWMVPWDLEWSIGSFELYFWRKFGALYGGMKRRKALGVVRDMRCYLLYINRSVKRCSLVSSNQLITVKNPRTL